MRNMVGEQHCVKVLCLESKLSSYAGLTTLLIRYYVSLALPSCLSEKYSSLNHIINIRFIIIMKSTLLTVVRIYLSKNFKPIVMRMSLIFCCCLLCRSGHIICVYVNQRWKHNRLSIAHCFLHISVTLAVHYRCLHRHIFCFTVFLTVCLPVYIKATIGIEKTHSQRAKGCTARRVAKKITANIKKTAT